MRHRVHQKRSVYSLLFDFKGGLVTRNARQYRLVLVAPKEYGELSVLSARIRLHCEFELTPFPAVFGMQPKSRLLAVRVKEQQRRHVKHTAPYAAPKFRARV